MWFLVLVGLVILVGAPAIGDSFGDIGGGYDFENENWYAGIEAGYEWGWCWLWGGVDTLMHGGPTAYEPFSVKYYVGGELTWRGLYFGIDHYCIHPVGSNNSTWVLFYDDTTTVGVGYRWGERR